MSQGPLTEEFLKEREHHVPRGVYTTVPMFVERAHGAIIRDVEGREFIDFAGGIGVLNVGHCPRAVIEAIQRQAKRFIHACFHVSMYEPYIAVARELNSITPGTFPKKTMLTNSGVEAVENAIKIARYYTGRSAIIAFDNAFHGRTLLGMSLTSKVKPYKFGFGPFAPEIYRMPFGYCYRCRFGLQYPSCELSCAEYLREFFISHIAAENVAAVIAEPIQGEGGFITPPLDYFQRIQEICRGHGIVFIMDEIQSGMGRTGKLYASEYFGVEPDLIITAKSLAAGMPLSAVTGRAEIMDAPHVGGLGGTYGGNPVSCAAALAVLEMFRNEPILEKARSLGERVHHRLLSLREKYALVGEIRGLGPMLAMELVKNRETREPAADEAKRIVEIGFEKGLILLSCGNLHNVIRILMPIVITDEQLDQGMRVLEEAISEVSG
ncbi:MAG: 4-aminobutyrate--2-oxoglutarate transaminase [Deltaproteobacteria bacterium]|nr:4-aminobutyrate--2-oxoglutarate transaminase [Deltaproteobacteria bacterium]MBW2148554.1 4-aminobutyrate--2-oxoglutarate transaminase [Deltaproteobacteria bacterium]MBW2308979.1 4-aminobutyrate--2-oxoglutarate transaminase [Deltaproteobacteria bacterium]